MSPFLILVFVCSVGGYSMTSELGALYGQRRSSYPSFRYTARRSEDRDRSPLSGNADGATGRIYYTRSKSANPIKTTINQDILRSGTANFRSLPSNPDKKEKINYRNHALDKNLASLPPNIAEVLKELVVRMAINSTEENSSSKNNKTYNADRKSKNNSDYNITNAHPDDNNDGDKSSSNSSEDEISERLFGDVPENISSSVSKEDQTNDPPKDKENNSSESSSNTEIGNRIHGFGEEFEMKQHPVPENNDVPNLDWKQSLSPLPVYPVYGEITNPFGDSVQAPPYPDYYQNAVPAPLDFLKEQMPVYTEQQSLHPAYQGYHALPLPPKPLIPRKWSGTSLATDVPEYSSLLHLESYNTSFSYQCGAIIISKDWALTSASCVDGFKGSDLLVRPAKLMDGGSLPMVESIVMHRGYKFSEMGRPVNDIALFKVNPPFSLSFQHLRPAKLAVSWQNTPEGSFATTIVLRRPVVINSPLMMSRRRFSTQTEEIQKSNASVISLQECSAKLEVYADNRNICTQRIDTGDNMNVCNSLRGSPMFVNGIVVGVVSIPQGCDTGLPDYHTQVSTYREWIAVVTGV